MEINFSKEDLEDIEFNRKTLGIAPDETVHTGLELYRLLKMVIADKPFPKKLVDDPYHREGIIKELLQKICDQILKEGDYWVDEEEWSHGDVMVTVGIDIIRQNHKEA